MANSNFIYTTDEIPFRDFIFTNSNFIYTTDEIPFRDFIFTNMTPYEMDLYGQHSNKFRDEYINFTRYMFSSRCGTLEEMTDQSRRLFCLNPVYIPGEPPATIVTGGEQRSVLVDLIPPVSTLTLKVEDGVDPTDPETMATMYHGYDLIWPVSRKSFDEFASVLWDRVPRVLHPFHHNLEKNDQGVAPANAWHETHANVSWLVYNVLAPAKRVNAAGIEDHIAPHDTIPINFLTTETRPDNEDDPGRLVREFPVLSHNDEITPLARTTTIPWHTSETNVRVMRVFRSFNGQHPVRFFRLLPPPELTRMVLITNTDVMENNSRAFSSFSMWIRRVDSIDSILAIEQHYHNVSTYIMTSNRAIKPIFDELTQWGENVYDAEFGNRTISEFLGIYTELRTNHEILFGRSDSTEDMRILYVLYRISTSIANGMMSDSRLGVEQIPLEYARQIPAWIVRRVNYNENATVAGIELANATTRDFDPLIDGASGQRITLPEGLIRVTIGDAKRVLSNMDMRSAATATDETLAASNNVFTHFWEYYTWRRSFLTEVEEMYFSAVSQESIAPAVDLNRQFVEDMAAIQDLDDFPMEEGDDDASEERILYNRGNPDIESRAGRYFAPLFSTFGDNFDARYYTEQIRYITSGSDAIHVGDSDKRDARRNAIDIERRRNDTGYNIYNNPVLYYRVPVHNEPIAEHTNMLLRRAF